jgi:hypothetical protein
MKITKSQLQQIIAEELEGFDPTTPRKGGPPAKVPCYLVYSGYRDYEAYVRYASGSLDEVRNFLRWARDADRGLEEYSVIEAAGDQIAGGIEKDITQEVLGSL